MGKAVKKTETISPVEQYEYEFTEVRSAADDFERHDNLGQNLLHIALSKMFDFGENIRRDPPAFEAFLSSQNRALGKVTKANPYNALVELAFSDKRSKSWRSEMSNVLAYASDDIERQPFIKWLVDGGGVSGRYEEAVKHFHRTASTKARKLRSARLNTISEELMQERIAKQALPGVELPEGFHRSLLYSHAGETFLVHVRADDKDAAIEKYLLEAFGTRTVAAHPLAGRPLFSVYRAIDLIAGTCKPSTSGSLQCIAIWNEETGSGSVTKLRFLSDAYSFTNATVTLARAVPQLDGKGQFVLELSDADTFRQLFQDDAVWSFETHDDKVVLTNDAKSRTRLTLSAVANYANKKLRQGRKLARRTRHFQATHVGMQTAAKNLDTAMTLFRKANASRSMRNPTPKRLQWVVSGQSLELGFGHSSGMMNLSYPFLDFAEPVNAITPNHELALADLDALWRSAVVYGEDLSGHIADSDVEDAAFCIDHTFVDGDQFAYVSPMVISVKMDVTQVCEDFVLAAEPPLSPIPPSSGPTSSASPSRPTTSAPPKAPPSSSTGSSAVAAATSRPRNYEQIEKNRRTKTSFPATPSSSGRAFGAFITSYLPDDADHRTSRKFDFEWQLEWWRRMTDIPVHVIASNWTDAEIVASKEVELLPDHGGGVTQVEPRILIENRIDCLKQLYASDFDWGIVMDDDAVLMQEERHNSSYRLFAEMAANGKAAYDGVDLFAPIYARKTPFTKKLTTDGNPYAVNHVFEKGLDLKGSMIVVRNFVKEGGEPVMPSADFSLHGEDTYLVLKAVSMGYTAMTCWNMILEELSGESTFAVGDNDRTEKMRDGHERLVAEFGHLGLKMKEGSHSLEKREFEKECWGGKQKKFTIAKP